MIDPVNRALMPDLLTAEDVAAQLRVSVGRARELIRAGRLGPYSRPGRRYILRRESVMRALEASEIDPSHPIDARKCFRKLAGRIKP